MPLVKHRYPNTFLGGFRDVVKSVAAAGTNQATANPVTTTMTNVTGADGTAGVRLPAAQAGLIFKVYNAHASNVIRVYPATGDDINDGSANSHVTVAGLTTATFLALDTSTWAYVNPLALNGDMAPTGNLTIASSKTLAVTTADLATVGGIIVPQHLELSFIHKPAATVTEWDLWVATAAYQVTAIRAIPSTLEGGALTATVCKATGTAAPANGTTPMHTANSINLNTGAYTVQTVTLTSTTADLQLAAGDRIGLDMSAAVGTAHFAICIRLKRI